ncbi:MAG: cell division ATPase MinD [Candidatus Nanoarchaeia archaeon]|nr:cell division ATPase MinD [Candidatus Nanoarchaeia archaeon]MDD5239100.1 cell division ATPase MinD [Candidatus Nanoarchaeia archaeon]
MTRFIVFASGKGGVGKTTLTTNLGAAIHKFGKDVIVVDGNMSTPNVSVLLGMPKLPVTLHDVLAGKAKAREAVYLHPSGLKIMPAGLGISQMKMSQKKQLAHVLNEFANQTEYMLIDCAAGLGQEAMQAMHAGDELILVTNPEIHAMTDALKAYEYAKEIGIRPIGVVVNKVRNKEWEMTKKNVEEFIELPVIGMIPEDDNVKRSIAYKKPLVYAYPKSPAARAIKRLAASIIGEDYRMLEPETFGETILRLIGF